MPGFLANKLRGLLRWAIVTAAGDDDLDFPVQKIAYLGKDANATMWFPYGYHANPQAGTLGILAAVQGLPEGQVMLAGSPYARLHPIDPGDVVIGSPPAYGHIQFTHDHHIGIFSGGNTTMTAWGNITTSCVDREDTTTGDYDVLVAGSTSWLAITGPIAFSSGGVFSVNCTQFDINNAGIADFSGAVTINGILIVNGDDFMNHTHGGVATGSGHTDGVD